MLFEVTVVNDLRTVNDVCHRTTCRWAEDGSVPYECYDAPDVRMPSHPTNPQPRLATHSKKGLMVLGPCPCGCTAAAVKRGSDYSLNCTRADGPEWLAPHSPGEREARS